MSFFKKILSSTAHIFYPHLCIGCGSDILPNTNLLCLQCINQLPHTQFQMLANNPIEKAFWGRLPLVAAHSEFYFEKETLIQTLIHQLKYKGNIDIGIYLGQMMANNLLQSNRFKNIDAIIPLPLFSSKEKMRGYNQAEIICRGMSGVLNIPTIKNNVIRKRVTETQTKKHRDERWVNVDGSFEVKNPTALEGKHLLLIDDVVTTGATLEACGATILKVENTKLSLATLALASR